MRVLMLSGDPKILEAGSDAALRMKEYGAVAERLDIFVLARRSQDCATPALALSQNVSAEAVTGRALRFWRAYFRISHALKRGGYDLITAQDIEHAFIAWLAARRFGIRWQMQLHTDIMNPYFVRYSFANRVRSHLARFLLPRASCVRAVSYRIARSIGNRASIATLPVYVDIEAIRRTPVTLDLHKKYEIYEKIILMAGRLAPEKNFGLAIRAMKRIVAAHPRALLVIAGAGPRKRAIIRDATREGVDRNVALEGAVPFDILVSYYKTADLYLLTSDYEGYGRTLVEAAAAGCPIVSTDVGIADEIKGAHIVPVADERAVADAVLRQLNFPRMAPELATLPTHSEYLALYRAHLEQCGNS